MITWRTPSIEDVFGFEPIKESETLRVSQDKVRRICINALSYMPYTGFVSGGFRVYFSLKYASSETKAYTAACVARGVFEMMCPNHRIFLLLPDLVQSVRMLDENFENYAIIPKDMRRFNIRFT